MEESKWQDMLDAPPHILAILKAPRRLTYNGTTGLFNVFIWKTPTTLNVPFTYGYLRRKDYYYLNVCGHECKIVSNGPAHDTPYVLVSVTTNELLGELVPM